VPDIPILTSEQLEAYERRGVLRLEGLLSGEAVRRAREAMLRRLAQIGLWRDGAWRFGDAPRPRWPDRGISAKAIGNKHADVEALLQEPALAAAVDALLRGRTVDRAMSKRPQVLFSLPNAAAWPVPHEWHADSPRLASGESPGVQLFTFLDTVEPRGGGTLVVAGSHRLLNDGRFIRPGDVPRLLGREDFFRELFCAAPTSAEDRACVLAKTGRVGDVALELIELTGAPGDAYLIDLRVLHSAAPGDADRPRMMATHRFMRADLLRETAEGFGWA
jgi:ectoine hydroxylase-related dioxygenase (phytanoyl-CoA dioxygenase family)